MSEPPDWEWLRCWRGIEHRFDGTFPHGCRLCGLVSNHEVHSPVAALRRLIKPTEGGV